MQERRAANPLTCTWTMVRFNCDACAAGSFNFDGAGVCISEFDSEATTRTAVEREGQVGKFVYPRYREKEGRRDESCADYR